MTFSDFHEMAALCDAGGYEPIEARYDVRSFGSWHIDVDGKSHAFRIIWDGKDRWLTVQVAPKVSSPYRHPHSWRDCWVGKEPSEQNARVAMAQMEAAAKVVVAAD